MTNILVRELNYAKKYFSLFSSDFRMGKVIFRRAIVLSSVFGARKVIGGFAMYTRRAIKFYMANEKCPSPSSDCSPKTREFSRIFNENRAYKSLMRWKFMAGRGKLPNWFRNRVDAFSPISERLHLSFQIAFLRKFSREFAFQIFACLPFHFEP